MITDRQKLILRNVIKEYVDSALPVSSQLIQQEYDFGISPATIRMEMQELENEGYLYQPHTSAGRVPTDKGYRFFVNELINVPKNSSGKDLVDLEDDFIDTENIFNLFRKLTKNISLRTQSIVISYDRSEDLFYKEGWATILKEPEFRNPETCVDLAEIVDLLEDDIREFQGEDEIKIYIGGENPFHKNKDFSLILSNLNTGDDDIVFGIIGPKRMFYDKNIKLINSLKGLLKKYYDR